MQDIIDVAFTGGEGVFPMCRAVLVRQVSQFRNTSATRKSSFLPMIHLKLLQAGR